MTRSSRTELLIGKEGVDKLARAHVLVAGLGGVGSFAVEALARAGVGHLYLVDYDTVDPSNINRQLLALESTIGTPKIDVALSRIYDINPDISVTAIRERLTIENCGSLIPGTVQYGVDAIDEREPKIKLMVELYNRDLDFISCMGAARAFDPLQLKIHDISKTQYCPLAKRIRKRLKQDGIIRGVTCIYSEEHRLHINGIDRSETTGGVLGSLSYMPGIMGLMAASHVIRKILHM